MSEISNLTKEAAKEAVRWYFKPVVTLARSLKPHRSEEKEKLGAKPLGQPRTSTDPVAEAVPVPKRAWQVDISPALEDSAKAIQLSSELARTLTLLIVQLMSSADAVSPIPGTSVRILSSRRRIILGDGTELAPLSVFYTISPAESSVHILDVMPMEAEDVRVSEETLKVFLSDSINDLRSAPAHRWIEQPSDMSAVDESDLSTTAAELARRSGGGTLAEIVAAATSETAA